MKLLDNYDKYAKFNDFKDLYKEFLESSRKEPKDSHDLLRCNKLQLLVDKAFNSYNNADKIEAVKVLVDESLAPQEWLDLQVALGGDFKTITTSDGVNSWRKF